MEEFFFMIQDKLSENHAALQAPYIAKKFDEDIYKRLCENIVKRNASGILTNLRIDLLYDDEKFRRLIGFLKKHFNDYASVIFLTLSIKTLSDKFSHYRQQFVEPLYVFARALKSVMSNGVKLLAELSFIFVFRYQPNLIISLLRYRVRFDNIYMPLNGEDFIRILLGYSFLTEHEEIGIMQKKLLSTEKMDLCLQFYKAGVEKFKWVDFFRYSKITDDVIKKAPLLARMFYAFVVKNEPVYMLENSEAKKFPVPEEVKTLILALRKMQKRSDAPLTKLDPFVVEEMLGGFQKI